MKLVGLSQRRVYINKSGASWVFKSGCSISFSRFFQIQKNLLCSCWLVGTGCQLSSLIRCCSRNQRAHSPSGEEKGRKGRLSRARWLNPPRELPGEAAAEGRVQCPYRCPGGSSKQPAGCPAVSYDCAEEELMASIEREYGR
uniref:Uncharacterized protein n=1 Tax=Anas platyrhynchos platyrhynchos TaxID=8840 RepID=A0A493TLH8_ANAPP